MITAILIAEFGPNRTCSTPVGFGCQYCSSLAEGNNYKWSGQVPHALCKTHKLQMSFHNFSAKFWMLERGTMPHEDLATCSSPGPWRYARNHIDITILWAARPRYPMKPATASPGTLNPTLRNMVNPMVNPQSSLRSESKPPERSGTRAVLASGPDRAPFGLGPRWL